MSVDVIREHDELAAANLEEARRELAASEVGKAFSALDRALSETHDPALVREAHALAAEAYERAGFVQRHVLGGRSILKAAEERLAETKG